MVKIAHKIAEKYANSHIKIFSDIITVHPINNSISFPLFFQYRACLGIACRHPTGICRSDLSLRRSGQCGGNGLR